MSAVAVDRSMNRNGKRIAATAASLAVVGLVVAAAVAIGWPA